MLTTILVLYALYTLLKIYISVMEIGYVLLAKNKEPIILSAVNYLEAARYKIAKEKLSILGTLVDFVLFLFWIRFGFSWLYESYMLEETLTGTFIAILWFLAINMIVMLPFDIYSKFVTDAKFGFNKSTPALFIKDTLISTIITVLVTYGVVAVVYFIINSSELWWLYTFGFLFGVLVLVNILFPLVRAKFFDRLSPLPEGELKTRLEALFRANDFSNDGLFISDASKRDSRLNAYFAGMGKSKRVVLFDTLVEKLSIEELEAVLGHELGHFSHKDIIKNLFMMAFMLLTTLAVFANMPSSFFHQIGVNATSGMLMMSFLLLSPLLFFVLLPIMGRLSRYNEFRADQVGSKLGGKENLVSALIKLVSENKSFPKSHPIYLFFYATHPPVLERFEAMGVDLSKS